MFVTPEQLFVEFESVCWLVVFIEGVGDSLLSSQDVLFFQREWTIELDAFHVLAIEAECVAEFGVWTVIHDALLLILMDVILLRGEVDSLFVGLLVIQAYEVIIWQSVDVDAGLLLHGEG